MRTSTAPRKSASGRPNDADAFSRELRTPASGFLGVVGDLNFRSSPDSVSTTQSVNVPPTSIPSRIIRGSSGFSVGQCGGLIGPKAAPVLGFRHFIGAWNLA